MVEAPQRKIPFLFGEDEPTLAESVVYSQLMTMNFDEMRQSQIEFEKNLVAKDMALADLNEPVYLLERGVIGESKEAHEALNDPNRGINSMAFKSEMIDILVFIGSLLNHGHISETELHTRLEERLKVDISMDLNTLLNEAIPLAAETMVRHYLAADRKITSEYLDDISTLSELVIRALQQTTISPEELNFHFAQVVVKNFVKYRPEVVAHYNIAEAMAVSRANFEKSNPEPITDRNLAKKQQQWAAGDATFPERSAALLATETVVAADLVLAPAFMAVKEANMDR